MTAFFYVFSDSVFINNPNTQHNTIAETKPWTNKTRIHNIVTSWLNPRSLLFLGSSLLSLSLLAETHLSAPRNNDDIWRTSFTQCTYSRERTTSLRILVPEPKYLPSPGTNTPYSHLCIEKGDQIKSLRIKEMDTPLKMKPDWNN